MMMMAMGKIILLILIVRFIIRLALPEIPTSPLIAEGFPFLGLTMQDLLGLLLVTSDLRSPFVEDILLLSERRPWRAPVIFSSGGNRGPPPGGSGGTQSLRGSFTAPEALIHGGLEQRRKTHDRCPDP